MKKLFAKNSWLLIVMILFPLAALSPLAARAQDGSVDNSFSLGNGPFNAVRTVAVQPDGKILIGGNFQAVNGILRNFIARLNSDGSLDNSFNPGTGANNNITVLILQPDGKILIGGDFTAFGGVSRNHIARLNANGSLDASFNPGTGANLVVLDIAMSQPDGKIIIGGAFTTFNGVSRLGLVRLNADGSVDDSFSPVTSTDTYVDNVTFQPDGKIIIGGGFTLVNGVSRIRLARLNADGSLDSSFVPNIGTNSNILRTVVVQPDGKILIGGDFSLVDNISRMRLARLNANGSLDTSFDPRLGDANVTVNILLRQPNGKVLVGGVFTTVDGVSRNSIARLNADGSLDASFDPGTGVDGNVLALALQPDGKIIVGGGFSTINGVFRPNIARLLNSIIVTNLTINNVSLNEGNSGTTAFNFTVSLSSASTQIVTVNYATADGTAMAPTDYQVSAGTLSFVPGETSKTITVFVNGDTTIESNETFTINLNGATNATITSGTGTGTILNDDACVYSIAPIGLNISAAGGTGNIIAVTTQVGCAYTAVSNNAFITVTSGGSGLGNGTVTFTVAANAGAARSGTISVGGQTFTVNQAASATFRRTPFDFDGDGKADISVYRPSNGTWYFLNSTAGFGATQWGFGSDKIVPGDYDGDGKTDIAVFRPSNGTWYLLQSTAGFSATQWGFGTDKVIPADYDGDGKADIAVYRPSSGTWYLLQTTAGFRAEQWGFGTDIPVPADYDGDGKADIAVFRPSNGTWYLLQSQSGFRAEQWGFGTDIPVPADYDGDGKTDIAVFRPSNGTWYLLQTTAGFRAEQWGFGSDIPIPAR